MRRPLLSVLLLFGAFLAVLADRGPAQEPEFGFLDPFGAEPSETVSWSARLAERRLPPRAGEKVRVQVTARIAPGWHLYHPRSRGIGVPVGLERVEGGLALWADSGLMTASAGVAHELDLGTEKVTEIWVQGEVLFEFDAYVTAPPGPARATVHMRYMPCTETNCLQDAVAEIPVEFETAPGGVIWRAELDPPAGPAGSAATLRLFGAIDEGWHLYHPDMDPAATGVRPEVRSLGGALAPLAGARLVTDAEGVPHPEPDGATSLWLSGEVEFRLPVLLRGEPGEAEGLVSVLWQSCDESRCNLPTETAILVPIRILGEGEAAPPRALPAGSWGTAPPEDGASTAGGPQVFGSSTSNLTSGGLWAFLLKAIGAALLALLTPCVFPMIPITVSFFTKRAEDGKGTALGNATAYALGIVLTFTALGLGVTALFGATGINRFASSPWLNLALAVLFVVFGLSLIGFFEIRPPAWLQRRLDSASASRMGQAGYKPVMVMAVAFSVTAFTCTVAFVGAVLVLAVEGDWTWALLGMTVFGAVFAAPFFFLALFPSMVRKLPRSGSWMDSVKVVLGFVEIAAAWKFLATADLALRLEVLTRPVVLILFAIPLFLAAAYLLGLFKAPHDVERPRRTIVKTGFALLFLGAGGYFLRGLDDRPLTPALDALLPPIHYGREAVDASGEAVELEGSQILGPAGLIWYEDFEEARQAALREGRLLFLDFTGASCANCRVVEGTIFPHPLVKPLLETFVRAELWVDSGEYAGRNARFQIERYGVAAQPYYVILDPRTDTDVAIFPGYDPDPAKFAAFLRAGLEAAAPDVLAALEAEEAGGSGARE